MDFVSRNNTVNNEKGKTAVRIAGIFLSVMLILSMMPWAGETARGDDGAGEEDKIIKALDITLKVPECGDPAQVDGVSVTPEVSLPAEANYESGGNGFWYGNGIGEKKDDSKNENADGKTENADGKTENTDGKTENTDGKTENTDGKTENTDGKTEDIQEDITEGETEKKDEKGIFEGDKSYYACLYLKAKEG